MFLIRYITVLFAAICASVVTWIGMAKGYLKPPVEPPKWLFGLMWTIIYVLFAIAWGEVSADPEAICEWNADFWFSLHLLLNVGWCVAYFIFGNVMVSLVIITLLLAVCAYQLHMLYSLNFQYELSKFALWVYFGWLTIATLLNISVLY